MGWNPNIRLNMHFKSYWKMRFNFSHFGNLPILARIFWKVPKYLPDIPDKQTYNKVVGIYRPEFLHIR